MKLRIAVLTCVWRRPELTDFVLAHYAGVKRRLAPLVDVDLLAAGSEGEASRALVERHGFRYVEHANQPLSDKWNAGLRALRDTRPDAVLIVGSDDLVGDRLFEVYADLLRRGLKFIGIEDMHFLDLATLKLVHWQGYAGPRKGEPIGLGRCIHRDYLDRLDWRLWEPGLDKGLDRSMMVRLQPLCAPELSHERGICRCDGHDLAAIDVKSGYNMWAFEDVSQSAATAPLDPHAFLRRHFPAEVVDGLLELRETLHPPLAVRLPPAEDRSDGQARILLGTVDASGQTVALARAMRAQGLRAASVSYDDREPGRHADVVYSQRRADDPARARRETTLLALGFMQDYDIFHFFAGSTLSLDHSDLAMLADLQAPRLMSHVGPEVRSVEVARRLSPWATAQGLPLDAVRARLQAVARTVRVATVPDARVFEHVRGLYDQVHLVPFAVDLDAVGPAAPPPPNDVPLVVHVTNDIELRGSRHVVAAVDRLASRLPFRFQYIPASFPPEDVRDACRQADIVIDQIGDGAYDVQTLTAMALGRPVVAYLSEAALDGYPEPPPLANATPETLDEVLTRLIRDAELRLELGRRARRYVERWHDARKVAAALARLYVGEGVSDRPFQAWW